jgi:hypothetical protein
MAFCSNCGNQLDGSERFCAKCGSEVSAKAGASAAEPVAAPGSPSPRAVQSTPAQPVQPVTAMPGAYAAPGAYAPPPGAIPLPVAVAQQPPAKKGVTFGTLVIVAALGLGGYYYYTHDYAKNHSPALSQSQNGSAAVLGKQQAFDAHWQTVNGFVQLTNGTWTNHANVAIQSATLECDQYDSAGNDLDQMRTTLNGPVQPGATDTFNPFTMGAVASNLNKVTCTIQYAKAASQ